MGIEGMDGIALSTGARGTPGLEGYPGVVLLQVQHCSVSPRVVLTDLLEQHSGTERFPAEHCSDFARVHPGIGQHRSHP